MPLAWRLTSVSAAARQQSGPHAGSQGKMRSVRPVLCTTIVWFLVAIAFSLTASAHNGADAVITASQSAPLAAAETRMGTVDELVVDNRVTGSSTRYTLLRGDDGTVVGLRGGDTESLFKGMR